MSKLTYLTVASLIDKLLTIDPNLPVVFAETGEYAFNTNFEVLSLSEGCSGPSDDLCLSINTDFVGSDNNVVPNPWDGYSPETGEKLIDNHSLT